MGHRDVISDGFNVDKLVDAIFLDLPSPWEVVPHVRRALKRGMFYLTFNSFLICAFPVVYHFISLVKLCPMSDLRSSQSHKTHKYASLSLFLSLFPSQFGFHVFIYLS